MLVWIFPFWRFIEIISFWLVEVSRLALAAIWDILVIIWVLRVKRLLPVCVFWRRWFFNDFFWRDILRRFGIGDFFGRIHDLLVVEMVIYDVDSFDFILGQSFDGHIHFFVRCSVVIFEGECLSIS